MKVIVVVSASTSKIRANEKCHRRSLFEIGPRCTNANIQIHLLSRCSSQRAKFGHVPRGKAFRSANTPIHIIARFYGCIEESKHCPHPFCSRGVIVVQYNLELQRSCDRFRKLSFVTAMVDRMAKGCDQNAGLGLHHILLKT